MCVGAAWCCSWPKGMILCKLSAAKAQHSLPSHEISCCSPATSFVQCGYLGMKKLPAEYFDPFFKSRHISVCCRKFSYCVVSMSWQGLLILCSTLWKKQNQFFFPVFSCALLWPVLKHVQFQSPANLCRFLQKPSEDSEMILMRF